MKVVGGVLKASIHSYAKIIPNSQVEGGETGKGRRFGFAVVARR
jgi:hypothetical protein